MSITLTDAEAGELISSPDVEFIEKDAPVEMLSIGKPDKSNSKVKGMKNNTQLIPWGISHTGAGLSMGQYTGKNIKVAILDTGISKHEDLKVKNGVSFVDYTTKYDDDNGHGTHVAGIIAAANNRIGVVGVAPEADIYAVKILDQDGRGSYSTIISALEWAIENQMDIISMSLGGKEYSQALHETIQEAVDAGIIIVAAAGNSGQELYYPAKYSEVIAVGAVSEDLKAAPFSCRGSELDLVAPGVDILSTANDGQYAVMSGTSTAAPHVSGAFASLKGKNPRMTANELSKKIIEASTPLGNKDSYGYGLLNVAKATDIIDGPVVPVEPDVEEEPVAADNENNDEHRLQYVDKGPDAGSILPAVEVPDQEKYPDEGITAADAAIIPNDAGESVETLATPSLTIISTTTTSVTFNAVFPTSAARGNVIGLINFSNGNTIETFPYDGNWYKANAPIQSPA